MMNDATQSVGLASARGEGTLVRPPAIRSVSAGVGVPRQGPVVVERLQRVVLALAESANVYGACPIARALGGDIPHGGRRADEKVARWAGRDDSMPIVLCDEVVDQSPVHSGRAGPALEVLQQRSAIPERPSAVTRGAAVTEADVRSGAHVLVTEIALARAILPSTDIARRT